MNSPLVQIRQNSQYSRLQFHNIPNHKGQPVVSCGLKGCFSLNKVIFVLQQQNVFVVIEQLLFANFRPLLDEVITDFNHLVQVINVPIGEIVKVWLHSANDFSVFDLELVKDFFFVDFIEGEELVSFVFLVLYTSQDDYPPFLIVNSEIQYLRPLVFVLVYLGFTVAAEYWLD